MRTSLTFLITIFASVVLLSATSFKPEIGNFNRVDAFRYGLKLSQEFEPLTLSGEYTYATGGPHHYYAFDLAWDITKKWRLAGGFYNKSMAIDPSYAGRFMTTLGALFAKVDYNDYEHRLGYFSELSYRYNRKFSAHFKLRYERHEPMVKQSDYSLFKKDDQYRENPYFHAGNYFISEVSLQFANLSNPFRPVWGYKIIPSFSFANGDKTFYKAMITGTKYFRIKRYQRLRIDFQAVYIDKGTPYEELYSFSGFQQLPGIGIREYILDRAVLANVQYNFDGKLLQYVNDWLGKNMEIAPALNFGYGRLSENNVSGQSGTSGVISTASIHLKEKYDLFEFVVAKRFDRKADIRFYLSIDLFDLLFGKEE